MIGSKKNSCLWIIYIGEVCKKNCQQQRHATVLALATLGNVTEISICVLLPKVAKESTIVTVACHCHWHYFAKCCQCKHHFRLPEEQ